MLLYTLNNSYHTTRMLELSKRKRMQIMEQVTSQRQRMTSAQRRRAVQQDYNKFIKTMNGFRQPNTSSLLKVSPQNSSIKPGKMPNTVYGDLLSYSPTVGEIPKPPTEREQLSREFYQVPQHQPTSQESRSPDKVKQINFYQPSSPQNNPQQKGGKLSELKEEESEQHSQVKDEEIHAPNVSIHPSSVNNSEAIFFTSEFKQFIDRQSPLNEQQKEQQKGLQKQEQKFQVEQSERALKTNKSKESLAFSNNSSLRFSLNDSAVHEAITRKITEELVLDSLGDSRFILPIKNLSLSLLMHQNYKDIIELARQVYLQRQQSTQRKKLFLEELLLQKEINLELRKNKIKVAQFRSEKKQDFLKDCFDRWKHQSSSKREKLQNFTSRRQAQTVGKSFRGLKMLLYDRKINSQVDMYYLSKIFFAFKSAAEKERRHSQQKAYKFYFKQLRKRVFNRFIDAVIIQRHQNDLMAAADTNYGFNLMRKAFESWKEAMPADERYVRLAMTTHIELKETQDKRLFQTRTFDFRELR